MNRVVVDLSTGEAASVPLTAEEIAAAQAATAAEALLVPPSVTPRQARLVLLSVPHGNGTLLDAVEAAIAAGPRADQITWEFAVDVRRDYPMIANLAEALELTGEQVDDLFRLAATL